MEHTHVKLTRGCRLGIFYNARAIELSARATTV